MKRFNVINRFRGIGIDGRPTGEYVEPGEVVSVPDSQVDRLIKANCIVPLRETEIETQVVEAPETAARTRRKGAIRHKQIDDSGRNG